MPTSPVLLLSDSFLFNMSNDEDNHGEALADYLSEMLGLPVDMLDDGRLDGKKVVVWSFQELNFVRVAYSRGWEKILLPKTIPKNKER